MTKNIIIITALISICAVAQVRLGIQPLKSIGIPGELHVIELTIESDLPENAVLRVPHSSNLVLRAVERYPVRRTPQGTFEQKRIILLQGVEAGKTVMTNLLVEIKGKVCHFPALTFVVLPVKPATPPEGAQQ